MLDPETTAYNAVGAGLSLVGGGGRGYLERHYDSGLKLPNYLDRKLIVTQEVERIARTLSIVTITGSIPKRLGPDASADELAADKKRARRVAWAVRQSLKGWQAREPKLPLDDDIRISAANLIWAMFEQAHKTDILAQLRLVSTWSIRNEDVKWGRSAVVKLENEYKWVDYALR